MAKGPDNSVENRSIFGRAKKHTFSYVEGLRGMTSNFSGWVKEDPARALSTGFDLLALGGLTYSIARFNVLQTSSAVLAEFALISAGACLNDGIAKMENIPISKTNKVLSTVIGIGGIVSLGMTYSGNPDLLLPGLFVGGASGLLGGMDYVTQHEYVFDQIRKR